MHRHEHRRERAQTTRVAITLLGGFHVAIDGVTTPAQGWTRRSAAALVKILALAPGHRLHREKVMDLLWPDESPVACMPRLHKAAHFARRETGRHDAVVLRDDVVWLFPDAELSVDVIRFEQLARTAVREHDPDTARAALAVYGGELLPADPYEDWAVDRRELLHLRHLDVLRVAGEWHDLVELDPTDEGAHIELMRRQLAAGDGIAAMEQYEHLERVLERELGVEPGAIPRQAYAEASRLSREGAGAAPQVSALLSELAELANRQLTLLAALAAVGAVG